MSPTKAIPEHANASLALAIIASSEMPMVLLDEYLNVTAASDSFWQTFALQARDGVGRPLSKLGTGEWESPQLASLLHAVMSGFVKTDGYEMDVSRSGTGTRSVVLNAVKLNYADAKGDTLLVTLADVTAERSRDRVKDDLLRDKSILLEELQHRVANSLQIIASVLMQSARRVQSEETRTHLYDAHHRVMSIATLQQQLATSSLEDVELHPYLTSLCRSLGASMILDANRIRLVANVDGSTTTADTSVSLGLVVTELVINALKHAFPDHRTGTIAVDYHSVGSQWSLSVSDDGVGTAADLELAKPGLGTAIVEALARKMLARVEVADASPGTIVSVVHETAPNSEGNVVSLKADRLQRRSLGAL